MFTVDFWQMSFLSCEGNFSSQVTKQLRFSIFQVDKYAPNPLYPFSLLALYSWLIPAMICFRHVHCSLSMRGNWADFLCISHSSFSVLCNCFWLILLPLKLQSPTTEGLSYLSLYPKCKTPTRVPQKYHENGFNKLMNVRIIEKFPVDNESR